MNNSTDRQAAARKAWAQEQAPLQYVAAILTMKRGRLPGTPISQLCEAKRRGTIAGFRVALIHAAQRARAVASSILPPSSLASR